ncbi:hypothetical protein HGRIS_003918 [Hohenbuehelia grisea]|uniref:NADP-dependent oxidoreductase domain-containing protein n=1 Tax=Hohenbuehelia grisea TaxID=104357 RepID=A0ABR3JHX2_9AGAR
MSSQEKKMPYVRLGNSGLKVSRVILGTMQYGSKAWQDWVLDEEEGIKHIKHAYDAGIQTFDTANMYSNGLSEVILGKAIKQHNLPRDEIVVMTKVYGTVGKTYDADVISMPDVDAIGYVNQHGLSRKHIFDSVKHSLERLQLDYIDLLQCHRFDKDTPIAETMQALHGVVKAGYVRYIGMSSCYAYQFHAMQTDYAINNKLTSFISMQNHHNLLYREEEREMFPTLEMFGVGAIPWSPLARGLLCRPAGAESTTRATTDPWTKIYQGSGSGDIINRVEEIAKKKQISMAQVALAWSLSKNVISAPIVGTTSLRNLQEMIDGVHITLAAEEIKYLEEPYQPTAVTGHV